MVTRLIVKVLNMSKKSSEFYCSIAIVWISDPWSSYLFYTLGFDAGDLSEDAPDDLEGLDASAAHIANLLSTEPSDGKFFETSVYMKVYGMG